VSRDLVLAGLVLIVCGALAWAPGLLPATSGRSERATWWRLWGPLLPAATALALLVGWALQEPSTTDELLRPAAALAALPVALVWARATWRAVRALSARVDAPAAVVGLLRPRVEIDARLAEVVSSAGMEAARAHEEAHARHRDPLRIWLAQLATDLQWPFGGAAARLAAWLDALELARDDEARRAGARGEDLAEALVGAARLSTSQSTRLAAVARLDGPSRALAARVERLLAPLEPERRPARRRVAVLAVTATLLAAAWLGFAHGDLALRALPFVVS
jgi:Zn-dependent protease with chaperone function